MINSMYTAYNGIQVSKTQIDVAMNNIANESTEGYKKRSVVVDEIGHMGTPEGHGSRVSSISRAVDEALTVNVLKTTGRYNYINTQKELLEPIDDIIFNGASEDVFADLKDSFSSLQNTPENAANRIELKGQTEMFVYSSNTFMTTLDDANHLAVQGAKDSVGEINAISEKIARVNEAVGISENPPLDLLDQREQLEKELSQYVKFTSKTENGEYSLTIDGADSPLVSGKRYQEVGIETETVTKQYTNSSGNTYDYNIETATLKFGIVNGDVTTGDVLTLDSSNQGQLLAQLDYAKEDGDLENGKVMMVSFLSNFRDDIASNTNDAGESMEIFSIDFTSTDGQYITTSPDTEFDKTDQTMIDAIISMFDEGTPSLAGATESMTYKEQENYIRTTLHSLYVNKSDMSDIEKSMVDMYEKQLDEKTKVDPNEEMLNVMKFQASYEAGAKMIQTIDEMIQTLLGMKR